MKKLMVLVSATLAALVVTAADVAGSSTTYTFVPSESETNEWSDTSRWYDSATASVPFGSVPGTENDVVFSRPISNPENPLVWPSATSVSIQAFNVGDSKCGQVGNYFFSFPSGSSFTVNGQSIWARNAGTVVANIDEGASVTFTDQLMMGRTANSSGIITNRGSLVVNNMVLGGFNGALGQIDLYGNLTVNGRFILGNAQEGTTGRLIVHEGATLSKPSTSKNNYVGIGEGAIGELVLEGVFGVCGGESIALGVGDGGTSGAYRGKIVMRGTGGIDSSASSGYLYVGKGTNTRGEIEMSGNASIGGTKGTHLYIGYGESASGFLTLSDNACIKGVGDRDPHFGYGNAAKASVTLDGNTYVDSANQFLAAEGVASTAEVSVAGTSYLKASTYFKIGTGASSFSKVTVGSGSYLKTGRSLSVATGAGATGILRLEGGSLQIRPYASTYTDPHDSLVLGSAMSLARFEGWGEVVSHTASPIADANPFGVYLDGGQVVADGAGEDRDLCLNKMTDVGRSAEEGNASGSNGWYAVNHGRVVYPHARSVARDASFCVGDYYAKTTPDLVNACTVSLVENSGGGYLHAALYAPDRTDVPQGVVCGNKDKILGIWRMGYATGETGVAPGYAMSFTSASLKFRYDALAAGKGTKYAERYLIETYRYDGTAWQKVATQENDTDDPIVTLTGITPYEDTSVPGYNIGWTAIVARYQAPGLAIIFK